MDHIEVDNDPVGARPQGFGHQALSSKPQEPAASPSAVSSTAGKFVLLKNFLFFPVLKLGFGRVLGNGQSAPPVLKEWQAVQHCQKLHPMGHYPASLS